MVLMQSFIAAWQQVLSLPMRKLLLKSIGLTIALLLLAWLGLSALARTYLEAHPMSEAYPFLNTLAYVSGGIGLFFGLAYLLPPVSLVVAGYYLDDAAEIIERSDFPRDPAGQPQPLARSLLYGLRFGTLTLGVNLIALLLFFVPLVNIVAFFAANAYLLGREYFELAAMRFHSPEKAGHLRKANMSQIFAAGAVLAGLLMVPLLNILTPLFGVALMVHMHKAVARPSAG